MRNFARRSSETEWMDTETVSAEEFARCLGDLATVNRLTLAHRPTLAWLARAVGEARAFSLLDVGYGHGDMLRAIARWAARRGKQAGLSGVDLDPSSALAARAATPDDLAITYHTGNVFDFRPASPPDFIISSLFTHHLTDAQVVRVPALDGGHRRARLVRQRPASPCRRLLRVSPDRLRRTLASLRGP